MKTTRQPFIYVLSLEAMQNLDASPFTKESQSYFILGTLFAFLPNRTANSTASLHTFLETLALHLRNVVCSHHYLLDQR